MTSRARDEESEIVGKGDLRAAVKRLSKGPMHFAIGTTRGREPVLLMHKTKSARALARELKEEHGAAQATHGVATGEGDELVLDVEGPRLGGMKKLVKLALKKERITTFARTRVRVDGEEEGDDDEDDVTRYPTGVAIERDPSLGDEGVRIDAGLAALRDSIGARGGLVSGLLPRLGQASAEERAALIAYCRDCAELEKRSRGCGDRSLETLGKSCGERARKIAGMLKGSSGGARPAPPPAPACAALGGSVGQGGANRPADVAHVQQLLVDHGQRILVDGKCGPATIAAIRAFQSKHLGMADGLVEPGRNTYRALCGQAPVTPPKGGGGAYPQQPGYPAQPGYPQQPYGRPPRELERPGLSQPLGHAVEGDARAYEGTLYRSQGPDGEVSVLSGSIEGDDRGFSASGHIARVEGDGHTSTLGAGEVRGGYIEDGDRWWAGGKAGVAGAREEYDFSRYGPDGAVLKAEGAAGTAGADAWVSDEGAALGLGANAGEGSVTLGSQGTGDRDGTVRVGVGEGVGLAGRLHWGDADKDGNREFGVGGDIGPVSFDVKTEDPLRFVGENNGPLGPLNTVIGQVDDSNMTNDALRGAEDAGRAIGGAVSDLFGE